MARKGSFIAAAALMVSVIGAGTSSQAATTPVTSLASNTLYVGLPGPFSGCSALSPTLDSSTQAVLDLVLPSAFQTTSQGNLVGEGGPIASAELTSLQPEQVQYSISPSARWSDGVPFTADDLVKWWMEERSIPSVASTGYRDISNFDVADGGLTVTATFTKPFADWNTLFRDVEASDSVGGCKISSLMTRPSLGPYKVVLASDSRIVLARNNAWPLDVNRFGKIIFQSSPVKSSSKIYFANLNQPATAQAVATISQDPTLQSRIVSSNSIVDIQFAPKRSTTASLVVRQSLSLAINRQKVINQLWGTVTYNPSPGSSVLYSQGNSDYPGMAGTSPSNQTTTTTTLPASLTSVTADCPLCSQRLLESAGYVKQGSEWVMKSSKSPLLLHVLVGPTQNDHRIATLVVAQWRAFGVRVYVSNASSDALVAQEVAVNHFDAGIFQRPTQSNVSFAASSWCGVNYEDSYPTGIRTPTTSGLCTQAQSNFNPVAARGTWSTMDQELQNSFWVRPVVTPPVLDVWSPLIAQISSSYLTAGMVDQIPSWESALSATTTSQ